MAIPFAIPGQPPISPERLRELYDFLQQLLIVCQQHHRQTTALPSEDARASGRATDGRMLSALSAALNTSRRTRRRRPKSPTQEDAAAAAKEAQNQRWKRVGTELRKIADEFESAAYEEVDDVDEVDSSLPCCSRLSSPKEPKGKFSKFLSMPVMISSICTAVLCVGWHLLRNR